MLLLCSHPETNNNGLSSHTSRHIYKGSFASHIGNSILLYVFALQQQASLKVIDDFGLKLSFNVLKISSQFTKPPQIVVVKLISISFMFIFLYFIVNGYIYVTAIQCCCLAMKSASQRYRASNYDFYFLASSTSCQ